MTPQTRQHRLPGSFRHPAEHLLFKDGRLFRLVAPAAAAVLKQVLATRAARQFTASGHLLAATELTSDETRALFGDVPDGYALYEHPRIWFPSFPYEWPPEMLHAAAELTLQLASSFLDEGYLLTDATPFNIFFDGPKPVFANLLSFEPRTPGDPIWLAAAQFERTFLLPLLLRRLIGLPAGPLLLSSPDGLDPQIVFTWLSPIQRLHPSALTLVTIPALLSKKAGQLAQSFYGRPRLTDPSKAQFVLRHLLRRLERQLKRLAPSPRSRSPWSAYMPRCHYPQPALEAKQAFVDQVLSDLRPSTVLDVGCNTGRFSMLAARHGASVVAIDADAVVVGALWRECSASGLSILPLVVDLARPSPSTGWLNRERPSFLERARGRFSLVLMLALIHHLMVAERIPLPELLDLASDLSTRAVIIEFVSPQDPMFRFLVRGRAALYSDYTQQEFERLCSQRFRIALQQPLPGMQRHMYLLLKEGA